MTILFVDHYDSFTNNLISWFESKKAKIKQIDYNNINKINSFDNIKAVIYSPGPGHPSEYKESLAFYKKIPPHIPYLGVCLGHQILLLAEGAKICQISEKPIHGRQTYINKIKNSQYLKPHELQGTFVLYNSLGCKIDDPIFTKNMLSLANEGSFNLAAEHKNYPRIGVQFHPESFASPGGHSLLNAF